MVLCDCGLKTNGSETKVNTATPKIGKSMRDGKTNERGKRVLRDSTSPKEWSQDVLLLMPKRCKRASFRIEKGEVIVMQVVCQFVHLNTLHCWQINT